MGRRLVVVGAGPIGLAAAIGGLRRGFDTTVLERDVVGASLRRWGPETAFFSPLEMNVTPDMGTGGCEGSATLTGPAFVDRVLEPLAASEPLRGRVLTRHRVVSIGRTGMLRGDFAGHPLRAERSFRLLVETPEGERWFEADAVLDATGTYGTPVWLGAGGLPALGERAAADRIVRDLGALHERRAELVGKRVLLVGHGHSVAHALPALAALDARVVWATRSGNGRPIVEVANDPLPERRTLVAEANRLASSPPAWLRVERRCQVEGIDTGEELLVRLSGQREVVVDRIVGLVGYRPDLAFLSELALEVSPATEGAAGLSRALANVTDCLSVPAVSERDLASGEPGFHLVGAKSYGRSRTFLLRNGYTQLASVLDGLTR